MECNMVNLELLKFKCEMNSHHFLGKKYAKAYLIKVFPQTWGSTALGFERLGGSSMTTALTTIFKCLDEYFVFFGDDIAYSVWGEKDIELFLKDLKDEYIPSVSDAKKIYNLEADRF